MKKLLAMVLALVMTLSLAVSASAFKDDKDISADYAEAVAVLDGMGVFQGYEDGSFKPAGDITRAEVATIIYRIYTGDVAKNDKSGLYATYNKFSDMTGAGWAAGYIGYCANAELVKGYPDGTFKPSGKITGYEVLAMILRAVGYDKNGEFSGADWALNVAKYAEQLGILKNVAKTTNLGAPATRELVAEMLFQAIQKPMVTYTPAFGYQTDKVQKLDQTTLGYKNFKLDSTDDEDIWGRPTTKWYKDSDKDLKFDSNETVYAEVTDAVAAEFNEPTTQCDICEALGEKTSAKVVEVYVNGDKTTAEAKALAETYKATETKAKVGEQGRIAEYYEVDGGYRLVVIDTYLAKVTDVVEEKTDSKGHVTRDDCLQLSVWNDAEHKNTPNTIYVEGNDYAEDAFILVHVNAVDKTDIITVTNAKATSYPTVEIVGEAKSFTGAQTRAYYQSNKHTVAGEDYMDAYRFYKDVTATGTVKYTWFLDQFGNLIGNDNIDNTSYAVLKNIYWTGSDRNGYAEAVLVDADGKESTVKVNKIDGISTSTSADAATPVDGEFTGEFTENLDGATPRVSDSNTSGSFGKVGSKLYAYMSTWDDYNEAYNGMALFMVEPNDDDTVNLQGYGEIEYAPNATINAKSSILSTYENSTATERTAKYAMSSNVEIIVREVNDDDEYVYNTDYTLKTLPEYADKSAEVYFVTDGSYVTKIYIKNATDASAFGTFIFMPQANESNYYQDTKTGKYYANVYVDGTAQTIEVTSAVGKLLADHEGMLYEVTNKDAAWETSLTSNYGKLKSTTDLRLVTEGTDTDTWDGDVISADYISNYEFLKGNTILVSKATKTTATKDSNIIDLSESTIVVWNGAEVTEITDDTFDAYGVWAVSKKGDYEGAAAYLYLGVKPTSTATEAKDVLDAASIKIEGTDLTATTMKDAAVAKAEAALEAAGITGVTVTVKPAGSVPAVGTKDQDVKFVFSLKDADKQTAETEELTASVTNNYSKDSIQKAIKGTLEEMKSIKTGMSVAEAKAEVVKALSDAGYALTDVEVTLSTDNLATSSVIGVTVVGTRTTFGSVTATAQVAVQAAA